MENKGITYQSNGKLLNFNKPMVMAIINLTPDSFYDGGKFDGLSSILKDAEEKLEQGAAILDLGAASARPNSEPISETEEWMRLEPVLAALRKQFPNTFISIDTYRSNIAQKSIELGAEMINDISGGELDSAMFSVISKNNTPYILMHMQGTPKTMQEHPSYENVVVEVKSFFENKINELKELGHTQLILDPGFGFGKTLEHNYQLLKHFDYFTTLGFPVLAGLSRKSMINKVIGTSPVSALNGTTSLNTIALLNGASILRVHDVQEAMQALALVEFYKTSV
jgi:dihydropteroate synthase